MSAPRIRLAGPDEDWPAIRALVAEAFAFMEGRIDPPSSIRRWTAATFAAEAAAGAGFLAENAGALIGCIFTRTKGDALYIGKLAVRPGQRGGGVARALIDAAEAEAEARGLKALTLQTRIELVENHATFTRLGFEEVGRSAHAGYARPTSVSFRRRVGAC
ncbi:MAG: GNAT family N-acetyltransferase [Paracoccaceae bacterium]